MEKRIYVLNQRGNLTQRKERDFRILEHARCESKLDAIVCLKHNDEIESGIEAVGSLRRRCSC